MKFEAEKRTVAPTCCIQLGTEFTFLEVYDCKFFFAYVNTAKCYYHFLPASCDGVELLFTFVKFSVSLSLFYNLLISF